MRFIYIFAFFCAGFFQADIGFAKAIEIRSENFIISGDMRQKDGENLLRDLEVFRKNIFKMLGVNGAPEIVPVKVYVAKNEKAMKYVTGTAGFGGVYTTTHNGPSFVLNGKHGFKKGGGARHIALHEYTHHIVGAYTELDYPRWYNEGYANYLATFSYKDGVFRVGDPHDPYAYSLRQKTWMPMTVVLGTVEKYPFNSGDMSKIGQQTQAQFYAQTWLAMHYLRNEEKYKGALSDYVQRLNKGERSLPAFKAAMGVTPEEFEVELKAYFKKNKYIVTRFQTPHEDIPVPATKVLSKEDAELVKLSAMRSFVFSKERRDVVIKSFEDFEAEYGERPETLAAKADLIALINADNEDYEAARVLLDKALAMDPDNLEANKIAAATLVHQYGRGLGGSAEDMKRARKYAAKVLKQDSQIPLANYSYALSFKDSRQPPANAVNAALYALDYYRDKTFIGSNLSLAGILLNGKEYDEAMRPIQRAIIWGQDPGMRIAAQSMRKYVNMEKAR